VPNTHSERDDHHGTTTVRRNEKTEWVSIFFRLSASVAAFSSAFVPAFVPSRRSPNLIRSDLLFFVEAENLRAE